MLSKLAIAFAAAAVCAMPVMAETRAEQEAQLAKILKDQGLLREEGAPREQRIYEVDRYGNKQYHKGYWRVNSNGRVDRVNRYGHTESTQYNVR